MIPELIWLSNNHVDSGFFFDSFDLSSLFANNNRNIIFRNDNSNVEFFSIKFVKNDGEDIDNCFVSGFF